MSRLSSFCAVAISLLSGCYGGAEAKRSILSPGKNFSNKTLVVQWQSSSQSVSENVGTAQVTAVLNTAATVPISVPYTVSGTASARSDHNAVNGTLTIPAGSTAASVPIAIVNDTLVEPNETIILTMGTPVEATPGTNTVHTITILNDDVAPSPTPSPTVSPKPSPSPTASPKPSPTPSATSTPSPTATATSTPQTQGGTGAIYFVSATGSDSNSGLSATSPWQSITKVNSMLFKPGDTILFKRGDTFYGTLTLNSSGIAGNPVTYGAYGSGAKPVLTGFKTLTGWTNEGGGIYSKVITSEAAANMVTVDGVNTAMGRYPNAAYLKFESAVGNTSITDNELGTSINWTGAEAVIRKNYWTLDRTRITSHSGNTLYYTNLGTTQDAWADSGYFIQNDLRTLDQLGEWYHQTSTGKFYMYFGAIDPNTKTVKVATLKNLINNAKSDGMYVVIDNLGVTGSISSAINLLGWSAQYYTLQNCDVSFFGSNGIDLQIVHSTLKGNDVSNGSGFGIAIQKEYATTINNRVSNIGMVLGQSFTGQNTGIQNRNPNNSLTQYNVIENTGYNGIFLAPGANVIVKNNFINNVTLNMNDGGGIYTDQASTNFLIEGNIILNVIGSTQGGITGSANSLIVEGIYLDEYSSGVTVRNNTVANASHGGIQLHKASNNIIRNNTFYNNGSGIVLKNSVSTTSMTGNSVTDNIFVAKSASQYVLEFVDRAADHLSFGSADYNYYARPIRDDYTFYTSEPTVGAADRTLAGWQSYTGQDVNSKKSPQAITNESDFQFEYNATQSVKVIPLNRPMIDIKGTKYSGSVTLQPYNSIVLMRDASLP